MKTEKTYKIFTLPKPFGLESGKSLKNVTVAYETYGTLNSDGTNAVLICHALTGDSHASNYNEPDSHPGWWDGVIGPGKAFDPEKHFVICSNILGSCYGTTGPSSVDPSTGEKYGMNFPQMTIRDVVNLEHELINALGVKSLLSISGGSLGGMQVLEWALMFPEMVKSIIPIATAVKHSPWCVGINETGRKAIMDDPAWNGGNYSSQPRNGLSTARMLAMISYRSYESFGLKFGREVSGEDTSPDAKPFYQVESYLRYQGDKLVNRFDANSYIYITRMLDMHDVTRGRLKLQETLVRIKAKTLCVGIDSDILYPPSEQKEISSLIPGSEYFEIKSLHGHDAFLIEFDQMNKVFIEFLNKVQY